MNDQLGHLFCRVIQEMKSNKNGKQRNHSNDEASSLAELQQGKKIEEGRVNKE